MPDKKIKLVLSGSGTSYPVQAGGVIRLIEEGYKSVDKWILENGSE